MASNPAIAWDEMDRSRAAPPFLPAGEIICVPWRQMTREIEAWDELALDAAESNPFFESWYLLASLTALDGNGEVSILRFEQDGKLRGLMPIHTQALYSGWPLAHISNWLHPNCFFGPPLVAVGAERPFWRGLLDWADANPGPALFLHLSEVALQGPLQAALEDVLDCDDRPWAIVKQHERALLETDLDSEAYFNAALSKQKRKDLRRRSNRLDEQGEVSFEWETGTANLSSWIDQFLAMEVAGWKGEANSALACDDATAALFSDSLRGAAERGKLLRLSLWLDEKPIAMLSTFMTPPGAFGFKTSFDEAYSRYSPGVLLER